MDTLRYTRMSIHAYLLLSSIQYTIWEAKVSFIHSAQEMSCFLKVTMNRPYLLASLALCLCITPSRTNPTDFPSAPSTVT